MDDGKRRNHNQQPSLATRTCFIDYLPKDISIPELSKIFKPYGIITNIFIPHSLRPHHSLHYAFVPFLTSETLHKAIHGENDKRFGQEHICIHAAKRDWKSPIKPNFHHETIKNPSYKPKQQLPNPTSMKHSLRDHRSYQEVCKNSIRPPQIHKTIQETIHIPSKTQKPSHPSNSPPRD